MSFIVVYTLVRPYFQLIERILNILFLANNSYSTQPQHGETNGNWLLRIDKHEEAYKVVLMQKVPFNSHCANGNDFALVTFGCETFY